MKRSRVGTEEANETKLMSNISYLNIENDQLLYRPKKPTPIDFFNATLVSQTKLTQLDEIRA